MNKKLQSETSENIKKYLIKMLEDEDWEVEDEFSCESKPNSVYDSSLISQTKNSLLTAKGSPRKGFNVEDLPEGNSFATADQARSTSFKINLLPHDSIHWSRDLSIPSKRGMTRNWSCTANRKSSVEILVGLQNKLQKRGSVPKNKSNNVYSPKKLIIIEE
jgi:hypothetical protein